MLIFQKNFCIIEKDKKVERNAIMNLEEIRTEIDALDKELLALFERRMDLCRDVALYKKEHNLPVFQPEREEKLLDKIEQAASPDRKHAARTLFSVILDISKQLQSRILAKMEIDPIFPVPNFSAAQKIGCQGTNGANSETASQQFFPGRAVTFYPTFEHVFQAVERGEVEFGVLPVYNSTSGSVTPTYDLLGKYNCYITAMNQVKIKHCLAVRPGVSLEQIQAVYSHPQALMQCSDFLKYHNLKQIEYSNTATAAAFVASSSEPFAAICSEECAKQNHMDILFSGIANVALNYTRFICISKQMMVAPDASVISIMMTLPNVPGSLSKILNQFYLQGLDLVKLESRPIQDGSFDVAFYVDFKGNLMDRSIAAFLNELCKNCQDFKLLGNAVEVSN
jgi:prephenate dehydratase